MKVYQTLPDTSEKEKIIGGILNINQFFWLLGGVVLGGVMFAITYSINLKLGGFLFIFGILSSAPFIFYKPRGLTLFKYLFLKVSFSRKIKKLPNKKEEISEGDF